jgi:hypothetical protein
MQEYGTGRYNKKHSTFFAQMMKELGLRREVEWCVGLCCCSRASKQDCAAEVDPELLLALPQTDIRQ